MINLKYFGKKIVLDKTIPAKIIICNIASGMFPVSEYFPLVIKEGETIIIDGPVEAEFNYRRFNYYPSIGFLFHPERIIIGENKGSNTKVRFEYTGQDWIDILGKD